MGIAGNSLWKYHAYLHETKHGFVWKCWVNIPNEIAISKRDNDQQNHWVKRGLAYFQTQPHAENPSNLVTKTRLSHSMCHQQMLTTEKPACTISVAEWSLSPQLCWWIPSHQQSWEPFEFQNCLKLHIHDWLVVLPCFTHLEKYEFVSGIQWHPINIMEKKNQVPNDQLHKYGAY